MILKQISTPTSALPARPERPIKYVWPVTAPDGSVGYDHPLENYFDPSMAPRLLPHNPPTRLYDTIARAHDHRFQVTPDVVDRTWSIPRPLILNQRERRRSLANLRGNSTDYMGISPDLPGWRPRRSSYEDRRGAVGVTPSEVNTLVPYIPPIDTTLPPPSREWLDEMAKRFLANAHADFEDPHRNTTVPLSTDDSFSFDYDTDSSTLDGLSRISTPHPPQQTPQIDSEATSTTDADTDTDTDTDTDMNDDDGYNWSTTRIPDSKWIIPRKRPSVVIVNKDVAMSISPPSSNDEHAGKRQRGGKSVPYKRVAKTPKRYANDTPARHGSKRIGMHHISESEEDSSSERPPSVSSLGGGTAKASRPPVSSITATALQMKHVRIASPCITSPPVLPQPNTTSLLPKQPKLFPCLLDGCTQICASAGDLHRHQQSLRHRVPSHTCLACGKSYTRSDALKRHLNSKAACRRIHATNLANNPDLEQVRAEANTEAV